MRAANECGRARVKDRRRIDGVAVASDASITGLRARFCTQQGRESPAPVERERLGDLSVAWRLIQATVGGIAARARTPWSKCVGIAEARRCSRVEANRPAVAFK